MAPKKSKRSASEDSSSDSGPDDRNPPPKKSKPTDKGSSKTSSSNKEDEHSFALDRNRFVKVREFKGKLFVDIREFYEKNGELLPGKKGISLNMSQWNKLKEQIDDIQESVEKLG